MIQFFLILRLKKYLQMNIFEAIKSRQSLFPAMYSGEIIEDKIILDLLDLANSAPTHRLTQPWRFIVITGEGKKRLGSYLAEEYRQGTISEQFSELKYNKKLTNPLKASQILAIIMKRDEKESVPEWKEIAAVSCAVQNIWIAACSIGLGCYWSTPEDIIGRPAILQLEHGERCLGLFYIGKLKAKIDVPKIRTPMSEKIRFMEL
jgi:nitroreductase